MRNTITPLHLQFCQKHLFVIITVLRCPSCTQTIKQSNTVVSWTYSRNKKGIFGTIFLSLTGAEKCYSGNLCNLWRYQIKTFQYLATVLKTACVLGEKIASFSESCLTHTRGRQEDHQESCPWTIKPCLHQPLTAKSPCQQHVRSTFNPLSMSTLDLFSYRTAVWSVAFWQRSQPNKQSLQLRISVENLN